MAELTFLNLDEKTMIMVGVACEWMNREYGYIPLLGLRQICFPVDHKLDEFWTGSVVFHIKDNKGTLIKPVSVHQTAPSYYLACSDDEKGAPKCRTFQLIDEKFHLVLS